MFDHVTIRVSHLETSRRFYDLALGDEPATDGRYFEWQDFSIVQGPPATRNLHVAFVAQSRDAVDGWWRRMTGEGYRDDGGPGPRPQYSEDYYGAFVLDPDGNSVEAVHHGETAARGQIDHLWIRVHDLEASKRFYEAVAPFGKFALDSEWPGGRHFKGPAGSFSLIHDDGPRTENLHFALPAAENSTVDEFHRALVAAGYRDNGGPGERPEYHPGYYGAFALDPDGNNVEVVCHNR